VDAFEVENTLKLPIYSPVLKALYTDKKEN
jgi:hypothetical protein